MGLLALASVALITACGGEDSGSSSAPVVSGNTAKEGVTYQLSSNPANNNYKIATKKDEKVIISYSVPNPRSFSPIYRCTKIPNKSFMTVSSKSNNKAYATCDGSLTFTESANDEYTVKYEFEEGLFNYVSFDANNILTNPEGLSGTPTNPRDINFSGENNLDSNFFNNYYKFEATKGQKIVVDATYKNIVDRDLNILANSTAHQLFDSKYNFISSTYLQDFNFEIPEDGTYIMRVGYISPTSGTFYASLID